MSCRILVGPSHARPTAQVVPRRSATKSCTCSARPVPAGTCVQPRTWFRCDSPVPRRHGCAASQAQGSEAPATLESSVKYSHLLLAILDSNPYLSDGSRQALQTAVDMARSNDGKITVLVVDEEGVEANPKQRLDAISWHLKDKGWDNFEFVEKSVESKSSVLVGDVADELQADLVVMSTEAVHSKHVDANQLAEFVPCPVLLLP